MKQLQRPDDCRGLLFKYRLFSWNVGCIFIIQIPNNTGGSSQFVSSSSSSFVQHVFGSFSWQLGDDKSLNSTRLHLGSSRINRLGILYRPSIPHILFFFGREIQNEKILLRIKRSSNQILFKNYDRNLQTVQQNKQRTRDTMSGNECRITFSLFSFESINNIMSTRVSSKTSGLFKWELSNTPHCIYEDERERKRESITLCRYRTMVRELLLDF